MDYRLRQNLSSMLVLIMMLFILQPAFAYTSTNQNQQPITTNRQLTTGNWQLTTINRQLTSIQWYISNGKDVVGTTDDAAEGKQTDSYDYTPYGRGTTLSSVAGSPWSVVGGRWSVNGRSGHQTVDSRQQNKILRSNNLSSKIQPCRAEAVSGVGPCRAEVLNEGGNLTQLRQDFRLRKATPRQASGQAFNINTNPFQYSGYYLDALSGLYYLNARYYSPELMRFISRDSYDLSNRYAYCDDDPVSRTDPGGHLASWINWTLAIASVVGGIATGGAGFSVESGWAMAFGIGGGISGVASGVLQAVSMKENGATARNLNIGSAIAGGIGLIADLSGGIQAYCAAQTARKVAALSNDVNQGIELTNRLRIIGAGEEGVVRSDGIYAYKEYNNPLREDGRFTSEVDSENLCAIPAHKRLDFQPVAEGEILKSPLVKNAGQLDRDQIVEFCRKTYNETKGDILITDLNPGNFRLYTNPLTGESGIVCIDGGGIIRNALQTCPKAFLNTIFSVWEYGHAMALAEGYGFYSFMPPPCIQY